MMPRILFLTQVLLYPLNTGAKISQYYMLRHLARRLEVTMVSLTRADDPPGASEHLREICQAVHPVPMRRSPWRNARAAVERIHLREAKQILLAEDAEASAEATVRLLTNRQLNEQVLVNGRAWVEESYASQVYHQVDQVYAELPGKRGGKN